jgi:hypothetical protein
VAGLFLMAFAPSPAGRATACRAAYAIATNGRQALNFNSKRYWVDAWFRSVRLRVGVRFHMDEEGEARSDPPFPSSVYIDLAKLDMNADVFVKHLHRFAPNLPIDRSLDNSVP